MSEDALTQRLAAIMSADAAGYSRLMSSDERGTVAALDAAREVFRANIEARRGRVVDMAGDSVLAIFETAAGATEAALAIQQALSTSGNSRPQQTPMRFRIGLHVGDVIEKADGTVYGDGVNIASRLQGIAQPGGVAVSDAVLGAVRNRVAAEFEDLGEQAVKNIAYPVRAYRAVIGPAASAGDARSRSAHPAGRPSIAVLPFDNMSGDPEQEHFADGLTEDLITALSRYRWLGVVGRNSSFVFKGKAVDVRRAAQELGASYIVEGSVRRAGKRLRITAQLLDGSNAEHIWAERYDRDVDDFFAVQDEITATIAGRLEPQLGVAERQRAMRKPTQNLGAWDRYQLGLSYMYRFTQQANVEAQRSLRRALELDPEFAQAHARLAYCMILEMVYFDAKPEAAALDEALRLAQRAVALDADDAFCHMALGRVHIARREYGVGLKACEAALTLNPAMAIAHCAMGDALAYSGRVSDVLTHFEQAIHLSPTDPWRWAFHSYGALALILAGRFEEAVEWAQRATLVPNCQYWGHAHLAAALGHLGRREEAAAALAAVKNVRPRFSLADARAQLFYLERREQIEHYLDGLRRAGLE